MKLSNCGESRWRPRHPRHGSAHSCFWGTLWAHVPDSHPTATCHALRGARAGTTMPSSPAGLSGSAHTPTASVQTQALASPAPGSHPHHLSPSRKDASSTAPRARATRSPQAQGDYDVTALPAHPHRTAEDLDSSAPPHLGAGPGPPGGTGRSSRPSCPSPPGDTGRSSRARRNQCRRCLGSKPADGSFLFVCRPAFSIKYRARRKLRGCHSESSCLLKGCTGHC